MHYKISWYYTLIQYIHMHILDQGKCLGIKLSDPEVATQAINIHKLLDGYITLFDRQG